MKRFPLNVEYYSSMKLLQIQKLWCNNSISFRNWGEDFLLKHQLAENYEFLSEITSNLKSVKCNSGCLCGTVLLAPSYKHVLEDILCMYLIFYYLLHSGK